MLTVGEHVGSRPSAKRSGASEGAKIGTNSFCRRIFRQIRTIPPWSVFLFYIFCSTLTLLCGVARSMNISDVAFQVETRMQLREDEIHLWRVDLAAVGKAEEKWGPILSADEHERASRFLRAQDRQYFTATRALLRTILASYVHAKPKELVFGYSDKNKPFLDSHHLDSRQSDSRHSAGGVEFNVSHSGASALLAFARGRAIGVDVEQLRDNFDHEAIARRFFSEQEQHQLAALAPSERYKGFFRCWTRKEAYVKAQGTGLSLPLHQFDVSLKPGDVNALLATRPDGTEATHWSLREVPASDGYVAALCVRGHGWSLKL